VIPQLREAIHWHWNSIHEQLATVGVKIKFTFLKPYYDRSTGFIQCYYNTGVAVLRRSMLRSTARCYAFNYVRTNLLIMQVRIAMYLVAKHMYALTVLHMLQVATM